MGEPPYFLYRRGVIDVSLSSQQGWSSGASAPDGTISESTGCYDDTEKRFMQMYSGATAYFGDNDGSRVNLSHFIDIEGLPHSRETNRIVIGAKGSGKTIFLRKFAADFLRDASVIVGSNKDELENPSRVEVQGSSQTKLLRTDLVLKVGELFRGDGDLLTEAWQLLWNRAILYAAASHLALNENMNPYVPSGARDRFWKDFRSILKRPAERRSPLTTIKQLIWDHNTRQGLMKHLNNPLWDDLETRVTDLFRKAPPLVFFIDAVDEDFAHAPYHWASCQKALFYEIMRLLRSEGLAQRLIILAALRDQVYHLVFRSEHASRYVNDSHILLLDWSSSAARSFLDKKTRKIPPKLCRDGVVPGSFAEWLGFDSITHPDGTSESVYTYAMRHIQCVPRDLVALGNNLGRAFDTSGNRTVTEQAFKEAVSRVAEMSGAMQIRVAANEVIAGEIPEGTDLRDYDELYWGEGYRGRRVEQVKSIIKSVEALTFDHDTFERLQHQGEQLFRRPDVASVLWRCGLLGFQPPSGHPVFFSLDREGRVHIPTDQERYLFHPSMCEAAGLRPNNDRTLLVGDKGRRSSVVASGG